MCVTVCVCACVFVCVCMCVYVQALLELVFGVKVVITGDGFVPGERSVIIMNHRTRLDWMFLWCCLLRCSYLRLEKICLKAALKAVPGFGQSIHSLTIEQLRGERDGHVWFCAQAGPCRWPPLSSSGGTGRKTAPT